jgi:hypothetical protein
MSWTVPWLFLLLANFVCKTRVAALHAGKPSDGLSRHAASAIGLRENISISDLVEYHFTCPA